MPKGTNKNRLTVCTDAVRLLNMRKGGENMAERTDHRKQFSKWLARVTLVFWVVYLSWVSVILFLVPEAGMSCVYLTIIVTVAQIIAGILYTHNSETEKILLTALDKTKIEVSIGNRKSSSSDDEGGENG